MQVFKTTLLMTFMTMIFMAVGLFVGGQNGALIALVIAGVSNIGMYWFSDKLVIKMQGAKPIDDRYPNVRRIVEELASLENMPMPKLYYVDTDIPNAFATGRSPRHASVAVTSGIMNILDDAELRAVLAHELGHVKNRDMLVSTIASTMAGAISYLAQFAFLFGGRDDNGNSNPFAMLLAIILAPIGAMIIQMAVSRSREYLADQHSAESLGSGRELETALVKLEQWKGQVPPIAPSPTDQATASLMFANMFSTRGLAGLFSTHPSTSDRVARLRDIDHRK